MLSGTKTHLRQSVQFQPYIGLDGYGAASFTAATVISCRIVDSVQKIVTREGEEKISTCQIYVDGAATITVRDKLTLWDASTTPVILRIDSFPGPDSSASYIKVIYT